VRLTQLAILTAYTFFSARFAIAAYLHAQRLPVDCQQIITEIYSFDLLPPRILSEDALEATTINLTETCRFSTILLDFIVSHPN
jgi:hypothetical protein